MALKIYWTDFAKSALQDIYQYYAPKAGIRTAQKLVEGLIKSTDILGKQAFACQKEELLSGRSEDFRYLVYLNYKIIYWFNRADNRIEIVDVFDTRQNPLKIKRE